MEIKIRPLAFADASAVNVIRRMDGVKENTLAVASDTVERTEQFIKNLSRNDHAFVAEVDGNVVGIASLMHNARPRLSHSASIGISVHADYQGVGVGTKLMETLIDLADNWMLLTRIELGVLEGNDGARRLYEKFGFVEEGVKKMAVVRDGRYVDEIMMGRIRIPDQFKGSE